MCTTLIAVTISSAFEELGSGQTPRALRATRFGRVLAAVHGDSMSSVDLRIVPRAMCQAKVFCGAIGPLISAAAT
jgi:hypothetical protein